MWRSCFLTVEFHLSRAYGKLEISSRRELSGALGEPDAAGGALDGGPSVRRERPAAPRDQ
jgi:hypothetical protein